MQMLTNFTAARMPGRIARPPQAQVLTVPGLDGSGPRHWQTHWERVPGFSRVELPDWSSPRRDAWVTALDAAISAQPGPLVLAAHSLGCHAVAAWAALRPGIDEDKMAGALLVAPPDLEGPDCHERLRDFLPVPRRTLPFPSMVVASRNDPYASFDASRQMARLWGSELVDAGRAGHVNADSALGEWSAGLRLVARLAGRHPGLLVAELGLRTVLS